MILAVSLKFLFLCVLDILMISGTVVLVRKALEAFRDIESYLLSNNNIWLDKVAPAVILLALSVLVSISLVCNSEFYLM